jgi:fimbrial chaperone protein
MTLRELGALAAGALLLAAVAPANAATLSVSPVLLEMSAKTPMRSLEVSNPGDQPVAVQLRVFAWSNGAEEDQFTATQDIGFSPPMFQLAPGARQVVRLAARSTPSKEMSYRLFIDQIQTTPQEGGISMPVRMALPLFVTPDGQTRTAVDWRIERGPAGTRLVARNGGSRRMRVTDLALEGPGGTQVVERGLAGYVLAGQERAWPLKTPQDSKAVTVRALTDQGAIRAELPRN